MSSAGRSFILTHGGVICCRHLFLILLSLALAFPCSDTLSIAAHFVFKCRRGYITGLLGQQCSSEHPNVKSRSGQVQGNRLDCAGINKDPSKSKTLAGKKATMVAWKNSRNVNEMLIRNCLLCNRLERDQTCFYENVKMYRLKMTREVNSWRGQRWSVNA